MELPIDWDLKVNSLSNKRFENRFVVYPKVFGDGDVVRIVGGGADSGKEYRVTEGKTDYDEFIKKATAEDSFYDYMDSSVTVIPVDEEDEFDHEHISPIYLEKA